ncbi:hypothetical protein GIB67_020186 [Kingdonia uniflora]|uniref:Uncharacterized protein n=1 Tax=Kingdonia uniflora TaxID=39325 RepID=A0A7J7NUH8_9MAGN|nr:hypothetical protein GIB67_020186 [Kingdonia uniflora]
MRQQLDLRIINNIQWDPFRNMKDVLKREVVIAGNISRKRVLLQCPFGGYEWYLGDHYWAQLEYRAVPYDPPEKLHCFPTDNLVTSLREAGWIEAQYYIVGHHVDYDAYWSHVSHGALMSDIARCGNIDIPGPGYDFFAMTEGMWKLTLDMTLDLQAQHLHDESRITHLTVNLRRADGRLSQLNEYLDGQGIEVEWEDDEGEAGTSHGRGSRG